MKLESNFKRFCVTAWLPLLLLLPTALQAQFDFTTNADGSLCVANYTDSGGPVAIPDSTNGLPVTSIETNAFQYTSLSSVTIPSSITNIGEAAFIGCYALLSISVDATNPAYSSLGGVLFDKSQTTLIEYPGGLRNVGYTIPNGVTKVGNEAFNQSQQSLQNIVIPDSVTSVGFLSFADLFLTNLAISKNVTSIGEYAFIGCYILPAIIVDTNNPAYCSLDGVLFDKNQWALLQYPGGKADTYYMIPNNVKSVAGYAFSSNPSLTNVTIPSGRSGIGEYAFSDTLLTSISFPFGLTNIGSFAFFISSLTTVTIPSTVTSLGEAAFFDCPNLTSIYFTGDAPAIVGMPPFNDFIGNNGTVYYLPGTVGWSATFGGRPTALWSLPYPLILSRSASFGVQPSGFSFIISWATNIPVVVEACTNLSNPAWISVDTNNLTAGSAYLSDPQWTNYVNRFYRLRSP